MNKLTLWIVTLLLPYTCLAAKRQGDSVDSGTLRGRTVQVIPVGTGDLRFHPVFEEVPLGSSSSADYFVDFGPFRNDTHAFVKVVLRRTGGAEKAGLVGWVDGVLAADNRDAITIIAAPAETYAFSIKDLTSISFYVTDSSLTPAKAGFPGAQDFIYPMGRFVHCWTFGTGSDPANSSYFYAAGTMSDKSHVKDVGSGNEFTLGPPPKHPVECERLPLPSW